MTKVLGADVLSDVVAHRASSRTAMNLIDRYWLHDTSPGFDPESRLGPAWVISTPIRCSVGVAQLPVDVEVYASFGSMISSS